MEMSPHPQRALAAGDRLRDLVPDAGHLVHMPTHIDVLCGDYRSVVETNQAGIEADRKFLAEKGASNFYSLYRCHNYHFKVYGAMFLGHLRAALDAAEELISTLPEEVLEVTSPPMADWLEGFVPMKQHVHIRFGRWKDIVTEPLPQNPKLFCVTNATMRYAKGVAYSVLGDLAAAEGEAAAFEEALALVPDSRYVFNNRWSRRARDRARDDARGDRVPSGPIRHRLRTSSRGGGARRQPALRRALGLDAAHAARACRPASGAGPGRGGGHGVHVAWLRPPSILPIWVGDSSNSYISKYIATCRAVATFLVRRGPDSV